MDERIYAWGSGFFVALAMVCTLAALSQYAKADCGFIDYNASIAVTSNQTNFTAVFMNMTGVNGSYSYEVYDNLTNSSTFYFFNASANCARKTFFVINTSSQEDIYVFPNQTINLSFIVSPVSFSSYTVRSWGVFDLKPTTIYLDEPKTYNYTVIFPFITAGKYLQTFEVSNGKEFAYVTFRFNNTIRPEPRILKFDYPATMQYAKNYKVGVFGDNFDTAVVSLDGKTFNLTNTSEYYFEGNVYTMNPLTTMTLTISNGVKAVNMTYPMQTSSIVAHIQSLVLPAVTINQSSRLALADFGVDYPIPVTLQSSAVMENNQTPDYSYFIANEAGTINPPEAKALFVYLTPQSSVRGLITANMSSPLLPVQTFTIEFIGSRVTNPSEINITYYEKLTNCKIRGDYAYNATYHCEFDIPNPNAVDINNFQSNELQAIREKYESQIVRLQSDNTDLNNFRWMVIAAIILVVIGFIVYIKREDIRMWLGVRGD